MSCVVRVSSDCRTRRRCRSSCSCRSATCRSRASTSRRAPRAPPACPFCRAPSSACRSHSKATLPASSPCVPLLSVQLPVPVLYRTVLYCTACAYLLIRCSGAQERWALVPHPKLQGRDCEDRVLIDLEGLCIDVDFYSEQRKRVNVRVSNALSVSNELCCSARACARFVFMFVFVFVRRMDRRSWSSRRARR